MIKRQYLAWLNQRLEEFSAVGLLGARQIGKTTLALEIAAARPAIYLDMENYQDLHKLDDPIAYLSLHTDKLIILDEIQRKPELFMSLRAVIDQNRRQGKKYGQFLILGSASLDLLRQSSESLAGRISYLEMTPLTVQEVVRDQHSQNCLWLRGGYPDSFLATTDEASLSWRQAFIKTYLQRDILQFEPRISSETLRRLWVMLAHLQGSPLNCAKLAANLDVSGQTVSRYIDLLVDLFLVRRLAPWSNNIGKRLVKSPKIYVRDSGITHALLNITTLEDLIAHPVIGSSWEGFVIDNIFSQLPEQAECFYYRTAKGDEIDLVIQLPNRDRIAVEIKRNSAPSLSKGFYEACKDIQASKAYVIYPGDDYYPIQNNVSVVGLKRFIETIGR